MTSPATLALELADYPARFAVTFDRYDAHDRRPIFRWTIDSGETHAAGDDLRLGAAQPASERLALGSLLTFFAAYVEAVNYERRAGRESDTVSLFPEELRPLAEAIDSDELALLAADLEGEELGG